MAKHRAEEVPSPKLYAELPPRPQAFVDAYCISFLEAPGRPTTLRDAYHAAGYTGDSSGAPTRIKRRYQLAIEDRLAQMAEKVDAKIHELLSEVDRVALARLTDVATWGGNYDPDNPQSIVALLTSTELGAAGAAVKTVKVSTDGALTVSMHDKVRALELALKARGALVDVQEHRGASAVLYVPDNGRITSSG